MDSQSVECPACGTLDERHLVSRSYTIESCPKCGRTVRETDRVLGTNVAAIIAAEVAEIDTWLDRYANDSSEQILKRRSDNHRDIRWAVGTPSEFACECCYDQRKTGFVAVRLVTKAHAATISQDPKGLTDVAARFGLQPFCARYRGQDDSNVPSTDAIWGMVQYLDTNSLSTRLLTCVAERISEAMRIAIEKLTQ